MCFFRKNKNKERVRLSNKKYPYSEQGFKRVYRILSNARWIRLREHHLYDLLYGLLQDEKERDLIEELLLKVVYLDDDESRDKIREIADIIIHKWQCSEDDTLIVGAKKKDKSDGGDILIYWLRNTLGWKEGRFRTTYQSIANYPGIKNVIIADDFTGTGKRMDDVIKDIQSKNPGLSIRFVTIGMMKTVAKKYYPSILTYDHYAAVILSPGLNHETDKRINLMTQIEGYLSSKWKSLTLEHYHLGFSESGALYWNRQFRVPNNVYPVFWWGEKKDGTLFNALMVDE